MNESELPEQPGNTSAGPEQVHSPDEEFDPTETLGGGSGRSHGHAMLTPDQMRPPPPDATATPPAPVPSAEDDVTTDPDLGEDLDGTTGTGQAPV